MPTPKDERNAAIHRARKEGQKLKDLGEQFGLTPTRIASICNRIDRINAKAEQAKVCPHCGGAL